jgi:hypothetical protein
LIEGLCALNAGVKPILDLDTARIARVLASEVLPANQSGFTFCPRKLGTAYDRRRISERLYVVSIRSFQREFIELPTEHQVYRWLIDAKSGLKPMGRYIGGWRKGDTLVFDVSIIVRRLDRALAAGRLNQQEYIYHPFSGRDIAVIEPRDLLQPRPESIPKQPRKNPEINGSVHMV